MARSPAARQPRSPAAHLGSSRMFVGPDYWRNHFPTLEAQDHHNPGRSPGHYGIYK